MGDGRKTAVPFSAAILLRAVAAALGAGRAQLAGAGPGAAGAARRAGAAGRLRADGAAARRAGGRHVAHARTRAIVGFAAAIDDLADLFRRLLIDRVRRVAQPAGLIRELRA